MKKKNIAIILLIIGIITTIIGVLAIIVYKKEINQQEINAGIHGVIIVDETCFYSKPKTTNVRQIRLLDKSENVYILDEFTQDNIKWYKVKVDKKINGYVKAENVEYYKEIKREKVLTVDVSKFDMEDSFETANDFEVFLLENKINYAYIRAGGRGYGEEGKFYEDATYKQYVEACEYLGIPYGFYFLDEALNSKEIDEEVEFIKNFLKENKRKHCVLPIALDVEKHDGKGRADDIWNDRAVLVQELIDDLNKENIDNILYTNAKTADLYLSELNTKFWLAYYPKLKEVPKYWYFDTEQKPAENPVLNKKTVGWQFTETGVDDEITTRIDLSLFKRDFYNDEK